MNKLIDFLASKGIPCEENVDGRTLCSFRVGGNVRLVARPMNCEQIEALFNYLELHKIKNTVLGRGSNVVISDEGYDGVIVSLSLLDGITVDGWNFDLVGAGTSMFTLATTAEKHGLTGLEFAHGIPGSVGGAIYMNAGAYGGEMSQVIRQVICFDKRRGKLVDFDVSECDFSYRHSIFQENENLIILFAKFELKCGDSAQIRVTMNEYKAKRGASQPLEYPSAGSTFKRPEGYFAAKLIDDAGLKGYTVGGAQVSEKHAGFVVNRGGATAKDIQELVEHIKKEVKDKFGVLLECEIEFI